MAFSFSDWSSPSDSQFQGYDTPGVTGGSASGYYDLGGLSTANNTQDTAGSGGWFSGALDGLSKLLNTGLNAYGTLTTAQTQAELAKQQQALLLAQAKTKTNASNTLAKLMPLIIGAVVVLGVIFGAVFLFKRGKD